MNSPHKPNFVSNPAWYRHLIWLPASWFQTSAPSPSSSLSHGLDSNSWLLDILRHFDWRGYCLVVEGIQCRLNNSKVTHEGENKNETKRVSYIYVSGTAGLWRFSTLLWRILHLSVNFTHFHGNSTHLCVDSIDPWKPPLGMSGHSLDCPWVFTSCLRLQYHHLWCHTCQSSTQVYTLCVQLNVCIPVRATNTAMRT
jgi:hypothetical protein